MKLEEIGFYSLSDDRAKTSSHTSRLQRCELILTGRCNFKCPYCRGVGGDDLPLEDALNMVELWAKDGLKNIRFSGGEPLLWPDLAELASYAKFCGIQRIAVSSNGSLPLKKYEHLLRWGVNDFSISLDACCAEDCLKMNGSKKDYWDTVINNIRELSKLTYVTVGIVLTIENKDKINEIIQFAQSLGVSDIRVIPAAQDCNHLRDIKINQANSPILKYRLNNLIKGDTVRGLKLTDNHQCPLVLDDMAVMGDFHYPCIIYMREGGQPIGKVGENMREERFQWYKTHNTHADPICSKQCLDVCRDYNNKWREFHI